jgi:hypothetical protein
MSLISLGNIVILQRIYRRKWIRAKSIPWNCFARTFNVTEYTKLSWNGSYTKEAIFSSSQKAEGLLQTDEGDLELGHLPAREWRIEGSFYKNI